MRSIDVMSAWVICGACLLVGSLMLALVRSDDPLATRALRSTACGFAVLGAGLFMLVGVPDPIPDRVALVFAVSTVIGMSFVVVGIGALAGRPLGWRTAVALSGIGSFAIAIAHAQSMRSLGLALASLLVVQALLLVTQVRAFIVRPQSPSERVLGLTLGLYITVAAARWALTLVHDGPLYAHLLHVTEAAQTPLLIVYAGMPILVAALMLNLLNERLRDRLRHQADVDSLTGALTRRALAERADAFIAQASASDRAVVVVLLDLDHFKRINDDHGHAAGDAVLTRVAGVIRAVLPGDALFARWGGEEFVVLVALRGMPDGRRLAEAVRQAVADAAWADIVGEALAVTASIGLAMQHGGEPLQRALARADAALYRAKKDGRDRVRAELATA